MRTICFEKTVPIPEDVKLLVKNRTLTVEGSLGKLVEDFSHVKFKIVRNKPTELIIRIWDGKKKHNACARTISSHIANMITGVTKGYKYKMRFVYAHFPINSNIVENGTLIEIRKFLGGNAVRRVRMLDGVTVKNSPSQKDEIHIVGNDVKKVSQSAASIRQICMVKDKDNRKFLDGIYVSEKGTNTDE